MNIRLWVLQVLAAPLYGSSGVMKVFMFQKVSEDVPFRLEIAPNRLRFLRDPCVQSDRLDLAPALL